MKIYEHDFDRILNIGKLIFYVAFWLEVILYVESTQRRQLRQTPLILRGLRADVLYTQVRAFSSNPPVVP